MCYALGAALIGEKKQLNVSPYYDSNVRESFNLPVPTYGLKLNGRWSKEFSSPRSSAYGTLVGQTYLDAIYPYESKLIINGDLDYRFSLSQRMHLLGQGNYFQKAFLNPSHFYRWGEAALFLQLTPNGPFSSSVGYRYRTSAISFAGVNRFRRESVEIQGRYHMNSHFYLDGSLGTAIVAQRDFKARGVEGDTVLIVLNTLQKDRALYGGLHLRYQGNMIYGAQVSLESVSSNSVIGNYRFIILRLYLSGRWNQKTFYHLVLQLMNKSYQISQLKDLIQYRDPEELNQNRSYARIEHSLKDNLLGYVQVSVLRNETLLNQTYYNKTLLEAGIKFEF